MCGLLCISAAVLCSSWDTGSLCLATPLQKCSAWPAAVLRSTCGGRPLISPAVVMGCASHVGSLVRHSLYLSMIERTQYYLHAESHSGQQSPVPGADSPPGRFFSTAQGPSELLQLPRLNYAGSSQTLQMQLPCSQHMKHSREHNTKITAAEAVSVVANLSIVHPCLLSPHHTQTLLAAQSGVTHKPRASAGTAPRSPSTTMSTAEAVSVTPKRPAGISWSRGISMGWR